MSFASNQPSLASASSEPGVQEASIVDHETITDGNRFTVYKIELTIGPRKYTLFHRSVFLGPSLLLRLF